MRFLKPSDVPLQDLIVFRAFPLSSGLMLLVLLVSMPFLALRVQEKPFLWYVLTILAILLLFAVNDLRKALKPTAWLAALGNGDLYLKWRSYQNLHWGTGDIQVVAIPVTQILSASQISSWKGAEPNTPSLNLVELKLAPTTDTQALANHLAYRPKNKSMWGASPLTLHGTHKLLIEWRAYPSARHFLSLLEVLDIPIVASTTLPPTTDLLTLVRQLRDEDPTLTLDEARARAKQILAGTTKPGQSS